MASPVMEIQCGREPAGIQRDAQYWFSNGDTVFIAQNNVAFKTYVELLSRKSSVFNDLLNRDVPQPEAQETMDGCPVVHVTDEPEDFRILLTLIYDGWSYRKDDNHRNWAVVKVMITLGDKYHIPDLFQEGIEMLEHIFPRDMAQHRAHISRRIVFAPDDAIAIANVTEHLDPDLHAVALLLCCSLPITTLTASLRNPEKPGLSSMTLSRCLHGREYLGFFFVGSINWSLDPTAFSAHRKCAGIAEAYLSSFNKNADWTIPDTSAAQIWTCTAWDRAIARFKTEGMCGDCVGSCEERFLKRLQGFRSGVKEFFDISPKRA